MAREADIEAVSAIRVRGWQAAYAGIVPRSYLDAMTVEDDVARRRRMFARPRPNSANLVALGADGPVGWVSCGPYRSAAPGTAEGEGEGEGESEGEAEVYALYVAPELLGQGIGGDLLIQAHLWLKTSGFDTSTLWVLRDNRRARRFYERAGYRADGATQADVYDVVTLEELRYRRALV